MRCEVTTTLARSRALSAPGAMPRCRPLSVALPAGAPAACRLSAPASRRWVRAACRLPVAGTTLAMVMPRCARALAMVPRASRWRALPQDGGPLRRMVPRQGTVGADGWCGGRGTPKFNRIGNREIRGAGSLSCRSSRRQIGALAETREGKTMADEPAGTVSAAQAMMLLLLEPADLKRLERAGAIRPIAPGRYGLVELVQGYVRHVRKADGAVSSAALAQHFDCVPAYIRKLVDRAVIQKRADGRFDLDRCRSKYLAHLRAERKLSPKSAADTEFTAAKTALINARLEEKRRTLVRQEDVDALIDDLCGTVVTALSSLPARCAPRGDLQTRRNIEQCVREVRAELAALAQKKADEFSEPLEDAA